MGQEEQYISIRCFFMKDLSSKIQKQKLDLAT